TGSLRWLATGCSAMLALAACSGGAAPSTSAVPTAAGSFDLGTLQSSVAFIQTQGTFVTPDGTTEQVYTGSGFVVDPGGLIVTNNHVVAGGAFWKVQIGTNPTLLDARLLGVSECNDLAVLKVDGTFPALTLATSPPQVGEQIFVAGHPNGDPYTLTNGIVAKPPYADNTSWASVTQEIQITAQTYPGNSGSPVVNASGQVVGIQYSGGVPGSPIAGESFAIASTEAGPVINQLKTGQNLDTIGINGEAQASRKGIAILSVVPGSPADHAGVQAGDLMTNLNGTAVGADGTKATYCSVLRSHGPADALSVTVQRGGQTLKGEINGPALAVVGGGSPPSAAPTGVALGSSSPQVTSAAGGSTAIDLIQPLVPTSIWPSCSHSTDQVRSTVVQTAVCQPVAGVTSVWYDLYDNAADLSTAVAADAKNANASTSKACGTGPSDGTWQTTFTDGKVLKGPDLRLLCYTTSSAAWIEQAYPNGNVLFTVELKGSLADLFTWWKNNATLIVKEP
ncbi:MAG: S1C family serine protease, partial [Candidatus Limnocylindrales bacterium]